MARFKSIQPTQISMIIIGLFLIFGLVGVGMLFPAGFAWKHGHIEGVESPYAMMLVAMYVSLGIMLIVSSSDPKKNSSIINYTILSSLIHGGVMAGQALIYENEHMHFFGDIAVMAIMAIWLLYVHPKRIA